MIVGKRITVYFLNEWRQLFQIKRCNWYSFTLMHFYFEIDAMSKMVEATCTLLGLGFEIRIDRDFEHSEVKRRADEAYAKIMAAQSEQK